MNDRSHLLSMRTETNAKIFASRQKIEETERALRNLVITEADLCERLAVIDTLLDATNPYRKGGALL